MISKLLKLKYFLKRIIVLDKTKLPTVQPGIVNEDIANSFPIVCHYNDHTLLTKDGELVQIIEITGENISLQAIENELREDVRKALTSSIEDYKIAVYLHTIRSRKNIMPTDAKFTNEFAQNLNDEWCHKNNFDKQLINSIYISLVYQGTSHSIINPINLFKSLIFSLIKDEELTYLKKAHEKLNDVSNKILTMLQLQGARKLGIIETENGMISEQLTLYYYLLNLQRYKVHLTPNSLLPELANHKFNFTFNSIEIKYLQDNKFAAVFSLKDYYDLSPETLDQFLQLGFEYILSQIVLFVPAHVAKKEYESIAEIAQLSRYEKLNESNGLDKFMAAEKNGDCAYCRQQVTITIFSDNKEFFQKKVLQAIKELHALGIATIREDFNMAALFFGQLPGNFRFLKHGRFNYLDTNRVASYCTIFDKEVGNYYGSKWGKPLTLLRTDRGTPFYFNFHDKMGIGHTLIVGPKESGKTVISKFFITQSLKYEPRIIYIDLEGNNKNFIETIGGKYLALNNVIKLSNLNPFNLKSFNNDPKLFKEWLIDCIFPKARDIPQYNEVFTAIANKIYEHTDLPNKVEAVSTLIEQFNDIAVKQSAKNFFITNNVFGQLFTEEKSQFNLLDESRILGLDLSELIKDAQKFKAYMGVLLETILVNLKDERTLIYINNLDKLFDIYHFKQVFFEWLNLLNKKNGLLFGNICHNESLEKDSDYQDILKITATKIFLCDKNANKYFKKCYKLSDDEVHKIKSYSFTRRLFLIKQGNIQKMLSLNLSDLKQSSILLGNE